MKTYNNNESLTPISNNLKDLEHLIECETENVLLSLTDYRKMLVSERHPAAMTLLAASRLIHAYRDVLSRKSFELDTFAAFAEQSAKRNNGNKIT